MVPFLLMLASLSLLPPSCSTSFLLNPSFFGEVDHFPTSDVLRRPPQEGAEEDDPFFPRRRHNVEVVAMGPEEGGGGGGGEREDGGEEDEDDALFEVGGERSSSKRGEGKKRNEKKKHQTAPIMALEEKREDLEGPVRLKVDDKNGLLEEGPYKKGGGGRGGEDGKKSVPKICSFGDGGVPCQRVDSRVSPSPEHKEKKRRRGGKEHHEEK